MQLMQPNSLVFDIVEARLSFYLFNGYLFSIDGSVLTTSRAHESRYRELSIANNE